ncbi:MAG: ABC transporter ATP-binding protein [Candidatus Raymondbacteria bacterium RifOxyA12_full_50_37]|uniref:ABC transporter ATP-binding protein n=1 Tax=Candidatus Raymondbacteria bacterium RIFOXYD12_FULL_49_13 TaxID=1817890 RepID=A0A1F7F4P0_UNCRA|nr:MAG: ABC transporter ATP-binding protein [Candidatus Raymondbacteria bacterium RIFOXYA2_FULL_49_16]OGJ91927.1 MAG: ABC transporter ATP-binding protein [Candidatus Raymondbacteria bacterium RifOxyA12_full_50_37]OGJ92842.1 MAG: ABC transporter ATP-binding protein [Candidatus Raymondbacteria bacterium RifOxyC12_full_50_8]OGJ95473.1 MAG: ABC transporter ATP-binding protein [Candidatus Raymondbacteria bacterium RIFOXYC2_FULL_50_21]OGK01629.1 MAG: ABC transporter ATP-binding protein [Candidatus Ra
MDQQPIVEAENVTVRYGEHVVLKAVSAAFMPSRITAILGTSGCGKTTLLKTLLGLITPVSGVVRLFGHTLADQDSPASVDMLKKAGTLFQNGALLGSLNIAENVALPLAMHTALPRDVIDEMVHIKLSQVGIPNAAYLFPSELSGGMRKRAALARALALEPPLLFCDEPSAGLDPVTSAGLDDLLLTLRESLGITIVVVTHELLSIERIADSILFLHEGSVLYSGVQDQARKAPDGPMHDFFARRELAAPEAVDETSDFIVENVA